MARGTKLTLLSEAILCSLGLMAFSFFIHYKFPFFLLSLAALMVSAFIISRYLRSFSDLRKIINENASFKISLLYIFSGITAGTLIAAMYRWHLDISLFPKSIHYFAIAAALIGGVEELVFRGFIQEYVKNINGPFSILFSTISHTGYKCCLFLSPMVIGHIDVGFLALVTFLAGLIFGTIRYLSKSLLTALAAHIIFDILVYAEFVSAPWWVW
jgi:membrane protease YdiL (CAAX protease family)